jgi:hypothetical protein
MKPVAYPRKQQHPGLGSDGHSEYSFGLIPSTPGWAELVAVPQPFLNLEHLVFRDYI